MPPYPFCPHPSAPFPATSQQQICDKDSRKSVVQPLEETLRRDSLVLELTDLVLPSLLQVSLERVSCLLAFRLRAASSLVS